MPETRYTHAIVKSIDRQWLMPYRMLLANTAYAYGDILSKDQIPLKRLAIPPVRCTWPDATGKLQNA